MAEPTGVASFLLALAGAVAGAGGSLFAAGRYFGRQGRELENVARDLKAVGDRVDKLETDRREYARAGDMTALQTDINQRRLELDERINGMANQMATNRDIAAVREVIQLQADHIREMLAASDRERKETNQHFQEILRRLPRANP